MAWLGTVAAPLGKSFNGRSGVEHRSDALVHKHNTCPSWPDKPRAGETRSTHGTHALLRQPDHMNWALYSPHSLLPSSNTHGNLITQDLVRPPCVSMAPSSHWSRTDFNYRAEPSLAGVSESQSGGIGGRDPGCPGGEEGGGGHRWETCASTSTSTDTGTGTGTGADENRPTMLLCAYTEPRHQGTFAVARHTQCVESSRRAGMPASTQSSLLLTIHDHTRARASMYGPGEGVEVHHLIVSVEEGQEGCHDCLDKKQSPCPSPDAVELPPNYSTTHSLSRRSVVGAVLSLPCPQQPRYSTILSTLDPNICINLEP